MFLFFFFRDFLILALAIGIVLGFYQSLLTIKKDTIYDKSHSTIYDIPIFTNEGAFPNYPEKFAKRLM